MDEPARQLVGVAWVARRTGLHRVSVARAARDGRIPAYRVLGEWRFDPDEIEAWLRAGSNRGTTEPAQVQEPARAAPAAQGHQRGRATIPAPESTPRLVPLYPDAAWRGIYEEVPAEEPARPTVRRGARTRKAALSR